MINEGISDMKHDVIEAISAKATYAGSATAILFGVTANELAAFTGVLVAILGLIVNIYFKVRSDRRSEQMLEELRGVVRGKKGSDA